MTEKLYPIKLNKSGRYLSHCDEHWYETTDTPTAMFDENRCRDYVRQLRNHYVYDVTIEGLGETYTVKGLRGETVAAKNAVSKKSTYQHLKELLKK